MNAWKDLFAPHILQRGYDYYQEGRVWDISKQGGRISALVSGTEEYQVVIHCDIDRSEVDSMDCDCPYAEDGSHCKHEAAVLYRLEEEDGTLTGEQVSSPFDDLMEEYKTERLELRDVIDNIPENEIRELLYDIVRQDGALKNRILSQYRENVDEKQMRKLRESIADIRYTYSDRSGFVDWRNASDYIIAMEGFLYDNAQPLIDRNLLEYAFELTCQVFLAIGTTDIDDDGCVAIGADTCFKFWKNIADKATDEFQKTMYRWFENQLGSGEVIDYMEDYLRDFLLTGFHSEELLQIRLEDLDALIAEEERWGWEHPDRRWRVYGLESHVLGRIQTMKELGLSQEEIVAYYHRFDYLPRVMIGLAEEYKEKGKIEEAIRLLESAKSRDSEEEKVVAEYSRQLISIFRESGAQSRLINELRFQIMACRQSDMHYVKELKEAVGADAWPELLDQIVNADTCKSILMDVYETEKMLPELMQAVEEYGSIYTLEQYEKTLRPHYAARIRDIYADHARKQAAHVSNRKQYQYLVKDLKKLTRYDGGREIAKEIARQWKVQYARRPAFMDELKKAGF